MSEEFEIKCKESHMKKGVNCTAGKENEKRIKRKIRPQYAVAKKKVQFKPTLRQFSALVKLNVKWQLHNFAGLAIFKV